MQKLFLLFLFLFQFANSQNKPVDFVYLSDVEPTILKELRYFSTNNFIGSKIDGYKNDCILLTKPTALALQKVQKELAAKGLSLKIFDAFRPQKAVNHFVRWAKDLKDTVMKQQYYPKVPKNQLFNLGYIASKSGHSRGSTVDLTLVDIKTKKELDMGSAYDFFGVESHPFYDKISQTQKENRMLLRKVMLANGFKPYENEWWHFTLNNEPYPTTYFNFDIE